MFGRAAVDDGVDDRDTDCAAEIAHHVEKPARIGDRPLGQAPQCELRRRQNAEHDGAAAHQLRPEHLLEIRVAGLDGT
jgi:hypothetical protein